MSGENFHPGPRVRLETTGGFPLLKDEGSRMLWLVHPRGKARLGPQARKGYGWALPPLALLSPCWDKIYKIVRA